MKYIFILFFFFSCAQKKQKNVYYYFGFDKGVVVEIDTFYAATDSGAYLSGASWFAAGKWTQRALRDKGVEAKNIPSSYAVMDTAGRDIKPTLTPETIKRAEQIILQGK